MLVIKKIDSKILILFIVKIIENMLGNIMLLAAANIIDKQFKKKQERDIWENSEWKNVNMLENDDLGRVGEQIIQEINEKAKIESQIDGTKTKQLGGGTGDGKINGKTCEIKTARLGSDEKTFQHELGEEPWKAEYMLFLDIAPTKMYITIFKNFSEDHYKNSGRNSCIKCDPYFPTKSITWRKQCGAFKLDTSDQINNKNKNEGYTFVLDDTCDYCKYKLFVEKNIK